MTSLRRLAVPACASLLMLAACGSSDGDTGADGATGTPADTVVADTVAADTVAADSVAADPSAPADAGQSTVPAALQFTAPAVGGGEIDAAAYAGTPTVFWFWAPT